jgi:CBS domain-containing protein
LLSRPSGDRIFGRLKLIGAKRIGEAFAFLSDERSVQRCGEMQVADLCRGSVIVARRDSTVLEAAQLMRRYHVGAVVVVDVPEQLQIPAGIVTDRDIVVGVVAMGLDPAELSVSDVMAADVAVLRENDDVSEAIQKMRHEGVRRMPVVNDQGALTGIISLDDLLVVVAEEMFDLARLPLVGRKQECEFRH